MKIRQDKSVQKQGAEYEFGIHLWYNIEWKRVDV